MEKFLFNLTKIDRERLDAVSKKMELSRSAVIRILVRREYERLELDEKVKA